LRNYRSVPNNLIGLPVDNGDVVLANRTAQAINDAVEIRKEPGVARMDHVSIGHLFLSRYYCQKLIMTAARTFDLRYRMETKDAQAAKTTKSGQSMPERVTRLLSRAIKVVRVPAACSEGCRPHPFPAVPRLPAVPRHSSWLSWPVQALTLTRRHKPAGRPVVRNKHRRVLLVEDGQPDSRLVWVGPGNPMAGVGRNVQMIAWAEPDGTWFPPRGIANDSGGTRKHHDSLAFVLVVPELLN